MFVDEEQGFGEHQWLDDFVEGLFDNRIDLCLVPARDKVKHLIARTFEVFFIGAEDHVREPCDPEPDQSSPVQESSLVQGSTERQG